MNANTKKLSTIAFAVSLALAAGGAWAVGNEITFEAAQKSGVVNGKNNVGNIDASGGEGVAVNIRQISGQSDHIIDDATVMNQAGDYLGGAAPLTVSDTAIVKIGQGVKFQTATPTSFDNTTEAGSVNNLVKGNISGNSATYISQTGSNSTDVDTHAGTTGRLVTITSQSSGTLHVNQTAGAEAVLVTSMTGGELTANQAGAGQKLTVSEFDDGVTVVNQNAAATGSTLDLTNLSTAHTGTYGNGATPVTINQNGAYQTTTVQYVNGGYNGTLNLDAKGAADTANVYSTVDVKL